MKPSDAYRYPPDAVLGFDSRRGSFTLLCVGLVFVAAAVDVVLFGWETTSIPYNYPFFGDIVLLLSAAVLLRRTHGVVWSIIDELALIADRNANDPLLTESSVDPDRIRIELRAALSLGYHPAVLLAGALIGGTFVIVVMSVLGVFSAYPYLTLNFGFGAAHGAFLGPTIGSLYVAVRALREYIVDIDLLDPDGVGGYREIGDGLVTLTTSGVFFITLDFVVLSSVAFTEFTDFQLVVSALYLLTLVTFLLLTISVTFLIRRRLLAIRDRKMARMQRVFTRLEHAYWNRHLNGNRDVTEAVHILAMYSMFHQMSRMNMWPINLVSLSRLGVSVGFSLVVFLLQNTDFLL